LVRVALLACLLAVGLQASAAGDSRTPQPAVERARAGTQCVEPAEMRRNHMEMLKHQRDDTVRGGVRGAKAQPEGCIDCHAGAATRSVNQGAG
jgi:hypothetical protein